MFQDDGDPYSVESVEAAGIGQCLSPCTLRGLPGRWELDIGHITGRLAGVERRMTIQVPAGGAHVKLSEGAGPAMRTTGVVVMGVAAVTSMIASVWGLAEANQPRQAVPITLFIGSMVAVCFPGLYLYKRGSNDVAVKATVTPMGPRATRTNRVRFVGLGVGETTTRAFVPSLTFELE